MCEIGKPVEMIIVDPLVLPAPLPGQKEIEPDPTPVRIPMPVEEPK